MEIRFSVQYAVRLIVFLVLTSFMNANTKENNEKSTPSKAHHSESSLGNNGDKMNGLSKDSRQHQFEPKIPKLDYSSRNTYKDEECNKGQDEIECSETGGECITCNLDEVVKTCEYGKNVTVTCGVPETVVCKGERSFTKDIVCQYCYQTPLTQQICGGYASCSAAPRNYFKANCTVQRNVLCLGNRSFTRNLPCNWKNGYRWSTAFILSVTLGGFGADRFYLGRWQEGIGKLFSFGGLGLWTIVDIILIGVRYLGPADGSLFVD